jgi:hypothetical protein
MGATGGSPLKRVALLDGKRPLSLFLALPMSTIAKDRSFYDPSVSQSLTRPISDSQARLYWTVLIGGIAAVYILSLGRMPIQPGFGDGPSVYIASAESLAHGTGYRLIYYPQAPVAQLYPIGYPLLISPIFRFLPFGATSIFLARLLNVFCVIIWAEAARRFLARTLQPLLAMFGAAAIALTPYALEMAGQIKADIVFGAITISALVLAMAPSVNRSRRDEIVRGIAIGVLAACAMLVRTIGFTIVVGLAAEMVLNKRWRRFFAYGTAVGLALAPWLLWSFVNSGGTFRAYASENTITWRTPISHFWLLTSQVAPAMVFAPLDRIAYGKAGTHLHLGIIPIFCGMLLAALVVFGWVKLLFRRHLVALVLAPYMTIVFLWWFEPTRFVIPVLPLIVYCAVEAIRTLAVKPTPAIRKFAFAAAAICIAGALAVDALRIERAWTCGNTEGAEAATEWSQIHEGLDWIKKNTPPDAIVFSSYPAGAYLFTSRHTLDLNNETRLDGKFIAANCMDLDAQFKKAREYSSGYVFATSRYDYILNVEWGLAPVQRFIASHPGRLELKWSSNDGLFYIYKVID